MIRSNSSLWILAGVLSLVGKVSAQDATSAAAAQAVAPSVAVPVAPPVAPPVLQSMQAVEGGLTAAEAGRRAAETSRAVYRLREQARNRQTDVDRVIWLSIPRLNFSARYARLSNVAVGGLGDGQQGGLVGTLVPANQPIDNLDQLVSVGGIDFPAPLLNAYNIGANLTVPLSDYLFKLSDTIAAARSAPEVAALETQVAQQAAAVAAKIDYYAWAQAKLNVRVAVRAVEQARQRLEDMQRLLRSGRISQADVLQAQAFAATTELTAEQTRTAVLLSERKLTIAVHAAPGEKLRLGDNVLIEPARIETSEDPYREALEHRSEIAVLNKSLESVAARARAQRAGRLPKLEAFADLSYANPNPRVFPQQDKFEGTWQIGLQMSWSPTDMGVANLNAQDEVSRGILMRSQLRELQDSLQLEVLTATRGVKEARLNIATAHQVQQAATAAYEARATLYRNGRSTSFEILQAETGRINAEFGLVGAHIALHIAQVRLDHALGRPLY